MAPPLIDRWHGAVRVRFDEPRRRNPLGSDVVRALSEALSDDPAAAVVIGSTDPQSFSAGADLHAEDAARQSISEGLYDCYRLMVTRPGVVIAVVEGVAVGGGAQLAAAADLRVCGRGARWRWVGLGHGLAVGGWILPPLVGRGRAAELIVTSRWVDADEAARIGLGSTPTADPWRATAELADRIADLDAPALARLKQLSLQPDLLAALRAEREGNARWDGHVPDGAGRRAAGPGT